MGCLVGYSVGGATNDTTGPIHHVDPGEKLLEWTERRGDTVTWFHLPCHALSCGHQGNERSNHQVEARRGLLMFGKFSATSRSPVEDPDAPLLHNTQSVRELEELAILEPSSAATAPTENNFPQTRRDGTGIPATGKT